MKNILGFLGLFFATIGLTIFGALLARITDSNEWLGIIGGMLTTLGGYWIFKSK